MEGEEGRRSGMGKDSEEKESLKRTGREGEKKKKKG
jgi:hypothetical protein